MILLTLFMLLTNLQANVPENLPTGFSACGDNMNYLEQQWDTFRNQGQHIDVSARLVSFSFQLNSHCPGLSADARQQFLTQSQALARESKINFVRNLWSQIEHISQYRDPQAELETIRRIETELGETQPAALNPTQIAQLRTRGQAQTTARQATCSAIDNRRPPVDFARNQGRTEWCYAYAASDLLSHRYGQLVSAVAVADSYNRTMPWQDLRRPFASSEVEVDRGTGYMAASAALEHGLCLESDVRSRSGPNDDSIASSVRALERLVTDYQEAIELTYVSGSEGIMGIGGTGPRSDYNRENWREFVTMISQCYFGGNPQNRLIANLFPGLDYYEFLEVLHQTNRQDALHDFIQRACVRHTMTPRPEVGHAILQTSPRNYFDIFDRELEQGDIATVGYSSSVLRQPWLPPRGQHVSSLVGRRFNPATGNCEYLIKNSYGPNCNYHESLTCEEGMIWLPEERLARSVYEATWLD